MTRKAAIELIHASFKDIGIANLVISNLVYDENTGNKTVKWCINLQAFIDNFHNISGFPEDLTAYSGPSLFVNGQFSTEQLQKQGVLPEGDKLKDVYKQLFPDCTVVQVEGAGHFVHNDKALQVCTLIRDFMHIVD